MSLTPAFQIGWSLRCLVSCLPRLPDSRITLHRLHVLGLLAAVVVDGLEHDMVVNAGANGAAELVCVFDG
jgi:hypothetical protein